MNTHWWVDPAADVAGLFMTQALPFLDPAIQRAYETFERDCYA
jgi:hypothetical protein